MSSPHQPVPPGQSSHKSDQSADQGSPTRGFVIGITRLAFLGVVILTFCAFFPFAGWPAGLWWLFALPLVASAWILRTRTVISDTGLDLRTLWRSRHIDWDQVRGLRIPARGYLRIDLTDGTEAKLPAVTYDRLREFLTATDGRFSAPPTRRTVDNNTAANPSGE